MSDYSTLHLYINLSKRTALLLLFCISMTQWVLQLRAKLTLRWVGNGPLPFFCENKMCTFKRQGLDVHNCILTLYSDCVEHVFQQVIIMFSVILIYGHAVVRGPHEHRGQANLCMFNSIICMLCKACFLMFKHWFCWKYQYNKYMFNSIDIYRFIPVSGCVYIDLVHCFSRVPFMLSRRRWLCSNN